MTGNSLIQFTDTRHFTPVEIMYKLSQLLCVYQQLSVNYRVIKVGNGMN